LAVEVALFIGLGGHDTSRRPSSWAILSDAGGPIRIAACLVNSARQASLRNAAAVSSLVNTLPAGARILILTSDASAFSVIGDSPPGRVRFLELPAASSFTIWPQDPFLVLTQAGGRSMLLASVEFARADDREIVRTLADRLGWPRRTSRLRFEGGNIVADGEFAFIGADTVRENALELDLPEREVAAMFESELGRPVIVLGPVPQPAAHIDLYVTPLGHGRMLVADADWGADLAGRALREDPRAVLEFERACEEYFFGHPGIREIATSGREPIRPPQMVGSTSSAIANSRRIAGQLNGLAKELARRGFEVGRVPILGSLGREEGPGYPCLTYNNVLMERSAAGRIVYLPRYGFTRLDEAGAEAWERQGYEVKSVIGHTIGAMYGGSLRCCAKIMARADDPALTIDR
jgi:hypothetical protein